MGQNWGTFGVDWKAFEKTTKAMQDVLMTNTLRYGENIGRTFESFAAQGAPWVDRRGVARRSMTHSVEKKWGNRVTVGMGGSAKNYKMGPKSSPDYMEYLEFAHGKAYATIYPTVDSMMKSIRENMGAALVSGNYSVRIQRDAAAARRRASRWRAKMKKQHGANASTYTRKKR